MLPYHHNQPELTQIRVHRYKGFAPKAIRMGLGGGVCMATFEAVCHFMGTENTVDTDSF